MTNDELALLGDDRLSAEARVVGLLVLLAGDGGLTYPDLEGLIPDASRDRLRRAAQLLERTKWVIRQAGGRGHGDRFVYLASEESATYTGFRLAILGHLKDRMPLSPHLNALSMPASPTLRPPSSSPSAIAGARARVREGLLDPGVIKTLESNDDLAGCRGSLRDYLAKRVDPERQVSYIQRVVTSLQGADEWMWTDRTGNRLREDRTKILAAALNELASGDEVGEHFPDPPGGFGNLRSKVRYLVASALGVERDASTPRRSQPSSKARSGFLSHDADYEPGGMYYRPEADA